MNRVVCYCQSCQAFAQRLGKAGQILNEQGGSDILQVRPDLVQFDRGLEHLACLQVTPKGPLRWFAQCCNTPIGNTARSPKLSFVGLLHSCLGGHQALDRFAGGPHMHVFVEGALGDTAPKKVMPPDRIAAFGWQLLTARISGRYRTNPFFDEHGQPVVQPQPPAR